MMHIEFKMDPKTFKKTFVQAMMRKYVFYYITTMMLGGVILGLFAILSSKDTWKQAFLAMLIAFIPMILMSSIIAYFMTLSDYKKVEKREASILDSNYKMRFEKNHVVVQIQGKNQSVGYNGFRFQDAFGRGFILFNQDTKSCIVVPKQIVTKEQFSKIERFVKEAQI